MNGKFKCVICGVDVGHKAIKLLRAEHITHDLAGRFFHDLIPFEVRKVLAAFYTHPMVAEILAGLSIDSSDETVIDPACGSGTLLVAAYRKKQELYQKLYGYKDFDKIHKNFIENDLTGIDIMPFAAHISAINLAMQNIEQKTNKVRIATLDSLELVDLLKTPQFKNKGIKISPYTTSIQLTLSEVYGSPKKIKKKGAVSPEGKGSEFYLKPFDIVIMNPPFTDREKMPSEMREKLNKSSLGNICGHQINLWGYFLALADLLLKENGKVGAVIPIDIIRTKSASKIRNFIIKNYTIEYIIKPTAHLAFSEGASFGDILLIAKKLKPKDDDKTFIIFLKKSKKDIDEEQANRIVSEIESFKNSDNFEIFNVKNKELKERGLNNFIWATSYKSIEITNKLFDRLKLSKKLTRINTKKLKEGFHTSPKGLSQIVFITDPIDASRLERTLLIFNKKINNKILFNIKNSKDIFTIEKNNAVKSLKTITGLKSIDISTLNDFIITSDFKGFDKVMAISNYKEKNNFNWQSVRKRLENKDTFITVFRRFNPFSPNSYVLSFFSEEPIVPIDAVKIFRCENKEEAILNCLYLNSSMSFLKLMSNRQQTTGQYIDTKEEDLQNFDIIDITKLTKEDKDKLLKLFDKIKNIKFLPICDQFKKKFWARIEIDKTLLEVIGFTKKEINQWIPEIYAIIDREMESIKKLR